MGQVIKRDYDGWKIVDNCGNIKIYTAARNYDRTAFYLIDDTGKRKFNSYEERMKWIKEL